VAAWKRTHRSCVELFRFVGCPGCYCGVNACRQRLQPQFTRRERCCHGGRGMLQADRTDDCDDDAERSDGPDDGRRRMDAGRTASGRAVAGVCPQGVDVPDSAGASQLDDQPSSYQFGRLGLFITTRQPGRSTKRTQDIRDSHRGQRGSAAEAGSRTGVATASWLVRSNSRHSAM